MSAEFRQVKRHAYGKTVGFTGTNPFVFPPEGRVVLKVYEDVKAYEMPFRLSRLSLLGRAL